jgi:hypothetical protein
MGMNNSIIHLVVDTTNLNRPALTDALKGFDYREYLPGCFLVRDVTVDAVWNKIHGTMSGAAQAAIFPVDAGSLRTGKLPTQAQDFVQGYKAA